VRDDRDVSALFAAVDAYLRGRRRPWSAYPATFCARCGRRIVAGDGQIDLALLYPARRCAACYDHESHGGVDDKPDGHGGMAALMQCDVGGAVCYAPRKRVNYQFTNWCARHRIWCQRLGRALSCGKVVVAAGSDGKGGGEGGGDDAAVCLAR